MIDELYDSDQNFWHQTQQRAESKMTAHGRELLHLLNNQRKSLFEKCMQEAHARQDVCKRSVDYISLTPAKMYSAYFYNCLTNGLDGIRSQQLGEIRAEVRSVMDSCEDRFTTDIGRVYSQEAADKYRLYHYKDAS